MNNLPIPVDPELNAKLLEPRQLGDDLTETERRIAATWVRLMGYQRHKPVDLVHLAKELDRRFQIQDVTLDQLDTLSRTMEFCGYVQKLASMGRAVVRERLMQTAPDAVEDIIWAREKAREMEDYKETRLAAGQHLDMIGATEKAGAGTVNMVTVVLRGRNFDSDTLEKALPIVEVTEAQIVDSGG